MDKHTPPLWCSSGPTDLEEEQLCMHYKDGLWCRDKFKTLNRHQVFFQFEKYIYISGYGTLFDKRTASANIKHSMRHNASGRHRAALLFPGSKSTGDIICLSMHAYHLLWHGSRTWCPHCQEECLASLDGYFRFLWARPPSFSDRPVQVRLRCSTSGQRHTAAPSEVWITHPIAPVELHLFKINGFIKANLRKKEDYWSKHKNNHVKQFFHQK